jgi:hypothetical protein
MLLSIITCKKQFLVTDEDFLELKKLGLPIEVFCPVLCKTVAFGFLENWDLNHARVNGNQFAREEVIFFG